ncbi:MAG: NAD(P)H-dependent glycerol-3-phosphate dehydrogenase [Oscillospiraceae bacterium]|jgi:glycerol-3-phosphate dehydrogenase (NAD(P)+)
MKIAVLGSGGWGTALALLLLGNGHDVFLWSHSEERAQEMAHTRVNPMLKGIFLPETLGITSDMEAAVAGAGMVVSAVPSYAVGDMAKTMARVIAPGVAVVSVSKGIERNTGLRLTQVIAAELGEKNPVSALCGPSHAEEVAKGMPTACVAASPDRNVAEWVQDAFMNERFRVYTSPDLIGAELGAALKNVVALCCGVCDGMGFGDNTRAMLMTRGLAEMARLGVALGGLRETFGGLTGVGDLIVTCTSMHSRNRRAGILIGQGHSPEEAMRRVGAVVEGYYATDNARFLAQKAGVDMPIVKAAYQVLYEGGDVNHMMEELMRRTRKHEIEESWT